MQDQAIFREVFMSFCRGEDPVFRWQLGDETHIFVKRGYKPGICRVYYGRVSEQGEPDTPACPLGDLTFLALFSCSTGDFYTSGNTLRELLGITTLPMSGLSCRQEEVAAAQSFDKEHAIDRNGFLAYLRGAEPALEGQVCNQHYEFIKIPCRPGVVGVYGRKCRPETGGADSLGTDRLLYMGFYCSGTGEMYNCPDFFWRAFIINGVSLDSQRMLFASSLRRVVADHVLEHPEQFGEDRITTAAAEGRDIASEADGKARLAYFNQKSIAELDVPLGDIQPGLVIDFLNDKSRILQREMERYVAGNTAVLALNLKVLHMAQELIRLIKKEKNCGPKRRRKISRAVRNREMVCVTVEKDGQALPLRVRVSDLLLEYGDGYDPRFITDEFQEPYHALFGSSRFSENEIVKISQDNQVLYEREGPAAGGAYDKSRAQMT